jgi:hypothetical protein
MGTYNRYAFYYSQLIDTPKMGVWSDAYYVTADRKDPNNNLADLGVYACAYDRAAMLAGQPAKQPICAASAELDSRVIGLLPADLDGTAAPPANSPNYMLSLGPKEQDGKVHRLKLFKLHADFTTAPPKLDF